MDSYLTLKIGKRQARISSLQMVAVLFFARPSIIYFFRCFGVPSSIVAGAVILLFAGFFAFYTISVKAVSGDGILLILLTALFFYLSLKIHPEYSNRYKDIYFEGRYGINAVFSIGGGIYAYYIVRLFNKNMKKLLDSLKILAVILFIGNLPRPFLEVASQENYNMDFGYNMSMAAIIFLAVFFYEKKKYRYLFLSIASMGAGVIYGSRACIIGYLVFVGVYFTWERSMSLKKGVILFFGFLSAIIYNSPLLLKYIYQFFLSVGINSRTMYLLAYGTILAEDTARQDKIWPPIIKVLKSSSIFKMYGAYGDRYYLDSRWPYVHNVILEILMTFGIFLGVILIVWIVWRFAVLLVENKNVNGVIALVFGCFSISRLMFSSSFWYEPYFWAFLAILITCSMKKSRLKIGGK